MSGVWREVCRDCGHTWGVTTQPRTEVLCTDCARPTPNRWAVYYWWLRAHAGHEYHPAWSPEWWDRQTSLADLRYAAELAATGHLTKPRLTLTPDPHQPCPAAPGGRASTYLGLNVITTLAS